MHPSSNPFGDLPDGPAAFPGEIVKAEFADQGPPDSGERLSILYLMIWTAGSAVILAFYRQTLDQPSSPTNPPWLQSLTALLMSPLQGAGVASLALAVWRRFKGGRPFPKQPGHWLLVIAGTIALCSWPLYLVGHDLFHYGPMVYLMLYRLPLLVLFCVLVGLAVSRMHGEERWRGMFLLWLAVNILGFLIAAAGGVIGYRTMGYLEVLMGGGINLAFLIPAFLDLAKGIKRDQLHWGGVAFRVANIALAVISIIRMNLPRT